MAFSEIIERNELIRRGDLLQTLRDEKIPVDADVNYFICNAKPVDAIPATVEAAVKFLTESGWMEKHDKEVWKKAEDYFASWDRAVRNRECQGMW